MSICNLDFNKNSQMKFGAYMQVAKDNNTTNWNPPRTLNAIYLKPPDNKKRGYKWTHIQTSQVVIDYNVNYVTITDLVIKLIESVWA